jgi:hypothetical protein
MLLNSQWYVLNYGYKDTDIDGKFWADPSIDYGYEDGHFQSRDNFKPRFSFQ